MNKIFAFALLFLMGTGNPGVASQELPTLTIGCQDFGEAPHFEAFLSRSILNIQEALEGKYIVRRENLATAQMRDQVAAHKLPYFFADSFFYLAFSASSGPGSASRMAVLWHPKADNPSKSAGGALIVRNDSNKHHLTDFDSSTLAAHSPSDYGTIGALKREILDKNLNPNELFREPEYLSTYQGVVEAVLDGKSDAGVIPACYLEERLFSDAARELRVIDPKPNASLKCKSTTGLYLGPVFASDSNADPHLNRLIVQALLNTKSEDGYIWTVGGDLSQGHELFKILDEAQYEKLSKFLVIKRLKEWLPFILIFLGALLALIGHWFWVRRLVEKRTAEIKKIQQDAGLIKERLSTMERIGVVGLMSSTLSHELKQPLAVIGNYLQGLRFLAKSGRMSNEALTEGLNNIGEQLKRSTEIIQKIRRYARTDHSELSRIDFGKLVTDLISDFKKVKPESKAKIIFTCRQGTVFVDGEPTSLQLAVLNLMKNAADACENEKKPELRITLSEKDHKARLEITDNGPAVSEEVLRLMREPFWSSKKSGMGLGLPIVIQIAESHRGSITFERSACGSVTAALIIPTSKESS